MIDRLNKAIKQAPKLVKERTVFLKNAILNPKQVAYVFPSGKTLIQSIAERSGLNSAKQIVELGPGTGGTTSGFLKEMRQDAVLCAVEINKDFVDYMNNTIKDKRLHVCHDGAQNLQQIVKQQGWDNADVVISGMPFSTLPQSIAQEIIQSVYDSLKYGGLFVAYQFRDRVGQLATPIVGEPKTYWASK
ncbi:MAG: methyltransferase domain-containing protein, partial [Proteobacteria bacterium]|nr:methyltransferase domain-containing protein [Pseudomonadota bacterium]